MTLKESILELVDDLKEESDIWGEKLLEEVVKKNASSGNYEFVIQCELKMREFRAKEVSCRGFVEKLQNILKDSE